LKREKEKEKDKWPLKHMFDRNVSYCFYIFTGRRRFDFKLKCAAASYSYIKASGGV